MSLYFNYTFGSNDRP